MFVRLTCVALACRDALQISPLNVLLLKVPEELFNVLEITQEWRNSRQNTKTQF